MANWSKPDLSTTKSAFPGECRALATSATKINPSGDTNIPTDAIWFDTANSTFKKWNGSSWVSQTIKNLASDALTEALIAAAIANAEVNGNGTTQGSGTNITSSFGLVSLVNSTSNTAYKLPALASYVKILFCTNRHASLAALLFPQSGEQIEGLSVDASYSLAASTNKIFVGRPGGNWHAF